MLLYACREIDGQSRGKDFSYARLQPVIQIAIMDHTLFPDHKKFFARYELKDEEGYRFSDKMRFYVMDLTAIEDADDEAKRNGLVDWAQAFTAEDWKTVDEIKNPGVKEARNTMEVIMSTPTRRQLVWDRRKAMLDRKSELEEAREQGMAQGIAQGMAQGIAQGMEQGAFASIVSLVKDGLLDIDAAAKRLNMPTSDFESKMNSI